MCPGLRHASQWSTFVLKSGKCVWSRTSNVSPAYDVNLPLGRASDPIPACGFFDSILERRHEAGNSLMSLQNRLQLFLFAVQRERLYTLWEAWKSSQSSGRLDFSAFLKSPRTYLPCFSKMLFHQGLFASRGLPHMGRLMWNASMAASVMLLTAKSTSLEPLRLFGMSGQRTASSSL